MTKDEALKLALEALEKLWNIIDDIDTYGDMAKADEKLYRSLVERRQRTRFEETGITTDGYELSGGAITAIKEALAQPEPVAWVGLDLDNMAEAFHRVIEEHHSRKNPFHDPVNGDAMIALRELRGLIAYMKRNTTPLQRTWVGLTNDELTDLFYNENLGQESAVSQAIALLKERNT